MKNKAFTLAEGATYVGIREDKHKIAFTLAEILITLGIIGVVAAITLPTVINNYNDKVIVTKLKKAYTILSQGYLNAVNEYGTPDNWDIGGQDNINGAVNIGNILFKNNIKVVKTCYQSNRQDCGIAKTIYSMKLNPYSYANSGNKYYYILTSDGMSYSIITRDENCLQNRGTSKQLQAVCAIISIDINNNRPPNAMGYDYFAFYLTKYGIIPMGTVDETFNPFNYCLKKSEGSACTAWVIFNGNRDYLKCPDKLGWDKNKSCKDLVI